MWLNLVTILTNITKYVKYLPYVLVAVILLYVYYLRTENKKLDNQVTTLTTQLEKTIEAYEQSIIVVENTTKVNTLNDCESKNVQSAITKLKALNSKKDKHEVSSDFVDFSF